MFWSVCEGYNKNFNCRKDDGIGPFCKSNGMSHRKISCIGYILYNLED
jgi:hypothetical protein